MTPAERDLAHLRLFGVMVAGILWLEYCKQQRQAELVKVSALLRARARQLEER